MQQIGKTKPHAICIPYPTQGHINPFMQLAKLLHSRGFFITFVNTEFNHKSFIESKGPESIKGLSDFLFETIPDGLPSSDPNRILDVRALSDSTRKHCLGPLKELLLKLNSKAEVPPVTCIVSDGVMSFAIKAAEEFGIPEIQFWTASACSFMGYLHFSELLNRGIIPFKDENFMYDGTLDAPINWIPGMKNVRLKDIPSFIRDTNDIMFDFLGSEALNCLKSSAIIFNTFDEFEYQVLEAISVNFPKIYNIGPLTLLSGHIPENQSKSLNSSLWKEDLNCLDWLNAREPNSVLYINYGSVSTITDQHFKEFALGLAKSNKQFLWIVRPDLVTGNSGSLLPQEFIEETKDRGFLTSWCPQEQVLKHPSVGFFLTHCGWNSIMETICAGVPIICWPFFADQQTNCRYACTIWEIGVEMNHNDDVKSHEVETLIKEMEGERGKKLRYKAIEWKKKAEKAIDIGGSSFNDFEKMIKELSLF